MIRIGGDLTNRRPRFSTIVFHSRSSPPPLDRQFRFYFTEIVLSLQNLPQ
jgi:hypothetical protein